MNDLSGNLYNLGTGYSISRGREWKYTLQGGLEIHHTHTMNHGHTTTMGTHERPTPARARVSEHERSQPTHTHPGNKEGSLEQTGKGKAHGPHNERGRQK